MLPKQVLLIATFSMVITIGHVTHAMCLDQGKLGRVREKARSKEPAAKEEQRKSKLSTKVKSKKKESSQAASIQLTRSRPEFSPSRGKLASVSQTVRRNSSRPVANHHDHDIHRRRHDQHRGHHHHEPGFLLALTSHSCPPPGVVPVAPLAPVPSTVVFTPPPVANEPTALIAEPIVPLCHDWFHQQTSKIWATIGSDFDGIDSASIGALFQIPGAIGLDLGVQTLRESTDLYRDHLWLGDVNVVFEGLSGPNLRGRIGIGVNWLSDSWGSKAGFNLTGGIDIRLSDRWMLSAEGDVGTLGDSDYFHGKAYLARRFDNVDVVIGGEQYDIGGVDIANVFTGMQFRF